MCLTRVQGWRLAARMCLAKSVVNCPACPLLLCVFVYSVDRVVSLVRRLGEARMTSRSGQRLIWQKRRKQASLWGVMGSNCQVSLISGKRADKRRASHVGVTRSPHAVVQFKGR